MLTEESIPSSSFVEHRESLDVFLQSFSFIKEGGRQWRSRDQWILVSNNLTSAKKDPPQDLSDPNSLGNQELDQSCVSVRARKLSARGEDNQFGSEGWSRTMCRSPIVGTLRKSSRICRKGWISQKTHHQLSKRWRPTYWSGDCLWRQQWKPPFTLDQITLRIWKFSGTRARGTPEFIPHHSDVGIASSKGDSECENDWTDISFMDEICTFAYGIFSQDLRHWKSSRESMTTCKIKTLNLRN